MAIREDSPFDKMNRAMADFADALGVEPDPPVELTLYEKALDLVANGIAWVLCTIMFPLVAVWVGLERAIERVANAMADIDD